MLIPAPAPELPAGFVEMAAQPLQVLLDEFRYLGKQYRPRDTEHAVNQGVARGIN